MYLYLFSEMVLYGIRNKLIKPQEWLKGYFTSTFLPELSNKEKYFNMLCEELYRADTGEDQIIEEKVIEWLNK
jgi:hypothetical protein